jgi:signal transduction histidine kinase
MKVHTVLRRQYPDSAVLAQDVDSFRRQESIFIVLNLAVLSFLLLIHTLFAWHWGNPRPALIVVLGAGFLLKAGELIWIQARSQPLQPRAIATLTWSSIALNLSLALLLAALTDRGDTLYFVIMIMPILEAAFRFPLLPTIAVITASDSLAFLWVSHFARVHGSVDINEYFEAGTVSLIYAIVGLLVWLLVSHLRQKEVRLNENLAELRRTRERLLQEEKLGAIGRLASAIAHEIRNPVAMISSSLATAIRGNGDQAQREEMFGIAAKEASRLERMTTDFLLYARPHPPRKNPGLLNDSMAYVADVCRAHAGERGVEVRVEAGEELIVEMDSSQVQQALLNLLMNAIDASPAGATVSMRSRRDYNGCVRVEVENPGPAIPAGTLARIFEPFFTTKPNGTGLGLAIVRNIVRAHGGDLELIRNEPATVCFSITFPPGAGAETVMKGIVDNGQNIDRRR